jgi:hypothetical protein
VWAQDEQEANDASAKLPQEQWRFTIGPAEVTEMDPGSIDVDEPRMRRATCLREQRSPCRRNSA